MTKTLPERRSVVIERDLTHPPERVWRAITQPHFVAEWLMPGDIRPEIGHRFDLRGDWGSVDCEVTEAEPPRRLAYRWRAMGLDSIVTFTLTPSATGTHLRLEQSGFRPNQDQAYQGAKFGWARMLGALEERLGRPD